MLLAIPILGTILTNIKISHERKKQRKKTEKERKKETEKERKIEEKKRKRKKERRGVCCSSLVDCNQIVKNRYFKSQKFYDI